MLATCALWDGHFDSDGGEVGGGMHRCSGVCNDDDDDDDDDDDANVCVFCALY
jgi:hypothetical protein